MRKVRTRSTLPNPYLPTSPGYAERHKAHSAEVGGGMVREDVGRPTGLVRDVLRDGLPDDE